LMVSLKRMVTIVNKLMLFARGTKSKNFC